MKQGIVRATALVAVLLGVLAGGLIAEEPRADEAPSPEGLEFFEKHIRPVLTKHCYECHAADSKTVQGEFLLDTREGLRKGGPSGPAVVPGDPEAGELIPALRHETFDMPPAGKLADAEIARFVEWIAMGAPDPRDGTSSAAVAIDLAAAREQWPYQPPQAVEPPEVKRSAWPQRPLDRFVLARLEAEGLTPVDPASKRTLIRRASFGLTGLPPTPEEVADFLADDSPEAFERVVSRLLDSPHYGERWARHWLDVARYAEDQAHTFSVKKNTNGYQYRDWVVEAFNRDLPYNEFVTLQIAGDLVPAADESTRREFVRALGFFGLGAVYYKNTDRAQAIADELDDRVDTLTRGFLGLTVSCARCHDHKFDPIPTQDYYSLAGVFHSSRLQDIPLADDELVEAYNAGQRALKAADSAVKDFVKSGKQRLAEAQLDEIPRYVHATWQSRAGDVPGGLKGLAEREQLDQKTLERWVRYLDPNRNGIRNIAALAPWLALEPPESPEAALPDAVVQASRHLHQHLRGLLNRRDGIEQPDEQELPEGVLFASGVVTKANPWVDIDVDLTGATQLYLTVTDAGDGRSCDWANWIEPRIVGPEGEVLLTELPWESATTDSGQVHKNRNSAGRTLRVGGEPQTNGIGTHAHSQIVWNLPEGVTRFRSRAGLDNDGTDQGGCGNQASVRFFVSTGPVPSPKSSTSADLSDADKKLLEEVFGERGPFQRSDKELEQDLAEDEQRELARLREELEQAKQQAPPMYPVAHGLAEAKAEDLKVYIRGNPARQGEPAPRRFLKVLSDDEPPPFTEGSGRLELAQAIASEDNPLTARVIVNRVWQQHFGRGLVATPSNFGSLGDPPTHPELLDWLAVRFMEHGWSLKWLHREILLSSTYQLDSAHHADNAKRDPENRLLWRANRRRLEVEPWRDALLSVSGQLDASLGGPSLNLNSNDNNRRTLYAMISRHELAQLLRLFDFPDANVTSDRRNVTTVPQQQLFVLNSPFMLRQARALVERLHNASDDNAQRIGLAYELLYAREAKERELQLGVEFLQMADQQRDPADRLDAWVQYAQALLAANEFLYID